MTRLHRRNFLPTAIVNLVLWIICGLIIVFLDPEKKLSLSLITYHSSFSINIILFFLTLTLSFTLTMALLFGNTRRGFLASLSFTFILLLRLLGIAHWWTILVLGIVISILEVYFVRRKQKTI